MVVSLNISSITRFVPTGVSRCPSAVRCRRPRSRRATGRRATAGAMVPKTTAAAVVVRRWMMRYRRRREVATAAASSRRRRRRRRRRWERVELRTCWRCRRRHRPTSPLLSRPRRRRTITCDVDDRTVTPSSCECEKHTFSVTISTGCLTDDNWRSFQPGIVAPSYTGYQRREQDGWNFQISRFCSSAMKPAKRCKFGSYIARTYVLYRKTWSLNPKMTPDCDQKLNFVFCTCAEHLNFRNVFESPKFPFVSYMI